MTALRRLAALAAAGALAGGAGACREVQEPPLAATGGMADSADQIIHGAHQLITDRGVLRAELTSDTAFVFNEGTRIELRNVNSTFFNGSGAKNATLTSREGTYNTQIGQMEARTNVVVISEDGRRLTTEQLRFNEQTNLITSDSAFTATEGARVLNGVGFESDPDMNNVRCRAACRGEAGQVNTPQSSTGSSTTTPGTLPAAGSRPNTFVLPGQQVPPAAADTPVETPAPTSPTAPAPGAAPGAAPAPADSATTTTRPTATPPAPVTP